MRYLLTVFLLAASALGQGYSVENFSVGTMTSQNAFNSWFGSRGTGSNGNGCDINTGTITCIIQISNSSGALSYVPQSSSVCGTVPAHSGGSSAQILDYTTTAGNGVGSQYFFLSFPVGAGNQSNVTLYSMWFCSNIPVTDNFGTTFDDFVVIGNGSQLSNFVCNGSACVFGLEGCSSAGQHSCPTMTYTVGTWVQLAGQYVVGAPCTDLTNFTDCVRLAEYDVNGTLIAQQAECVGGASCSGGTALPAGLTLGNLNAATMSSGHHVQHMNVKVCYLGCTAAEFPLLQNPTPLWDGLITPGRGTDWTKAGFPGSTLPDGAWTQCGTTLAAGTYSGSAISTTIAACANNTYYLLGAGNFTLTTAPITISRNNVVIRGSGANSTFLTGSGFTSNCGLICVKSTDSTNASGPPANVCNWTAGYAQGGTSITLSNFAGTCLTAISTTNPTMIVLDQDDTGYTGTTPTGSAVDNGNLFICGDKYATTPTGCSADGPDTGAMRVERDQLEFHTATAINTGTGVTTITPPLIMPNWTSGQSPQAWIIQPVVQVGVENLAIDGGNVSTVSAFGVSFVNAYQWWMSRVMLTNVFDFPLFVTQSMAGVAKDNYIYHTTAGGINAKCFEFVTSSFNIIQNNIFQQCSNPLFFDGASSGDVIDYNFEVLATDNSPDLDVAFTAHAGNYFDLYEGNVSNGIQLGDDIHGTAKGTLFRNLSTGWESFPSNPKTVFTNAMSHYSFSRYHEDIANVFGTPSFHTVYTSASSNLSIYDMGTGNGGVSPAVPNDSLTGSTSVLWANYDTVTAANRFCGNALDTNWASAGNCNSVSEAAFSASTYPGFIPVKGDTAVGQDVLPASLIFTARPAWWSASVPFPAIGPDVSSGNVGQCSGTLNTVGQFNGMPALTNAQCGSHGITASAWGGHVNAIPAMACYLNTMGGPPDGSGSVLTFNANACYSSAAAGPDSTVNGGVTINGGVVIR